MNQWSSDFNNQQYNAPQSYDQQYGAPQPFNNQGGFAQPMAGYQQQSGGDITFSAIALIVVGALCTSLIGSIFGIIALVQEKSDPESARRMLKIGWIITLCFAAFTLIILAISFLLPLVMGLLLSNA